MYSYPFCPSRVHRWGQGWVGVSLAALAAPAVQSSASSQMGLSYVLQAAVCSQREPFLGIKGAGRPPSASSCLALLTSTSSSFPMPSVCIFCFHWGGCAWSKWVPQGTVGSSCSAWAWLRCQAFLGLALVSLSLQEPLPLANQGFQVCFLGSSGIWSQRWPKCLLIHI